MCSAPQRHALFRHLNFQKWSGAGVFCTFWLPNVLRATTACTFSTSQLPKVVRRWCVLCILTWKCASRHSWRFGCGKSARRCGAKHISKSNCTKHPMFGPLLEVQMSKKCMPLWREVHFEVKMLKTQGFGPLLEVQMSLHYTTLHYTPLQYTTLHYTTLHYTTLPSTTLHYTTLHSTTLQLQLQLHNYTPLHSTTLHYTTSHYTTLHYTTLPSTTLQYTTLHSTTLQIQLHNDTTT